MTQWIGAIQEDIMVEQFHLKMAQIVFAIEEERSTRKKYDGGPFQ